MYFLMKRFFTFCGILFFAGCSMYAQGDIDLQGKVFYRNEKSIAILLNSNGFGLSGRYAKRINAADKTIYDVDFVLLKHPKEVKQPSQINPNASNFVYGKQNIAFNLRPGIGKQKEIFRKFDAGGISVRRYYSAGPSLSILKPIYYDVQYYIPSNHTYEEKTEKFSTNISQQGGIKGRASFFKGFNELKFVPGIYAKFGVSFEYSKLDLVIHSIDAGIIAEGFAEKLPIMATKENNQFYLTLFISYRLGKVIDPNAIKKKTKSEDFF
jgi:hypothetical protein